MVVVLIGPGTFSRGEGFEYVGEAVVIEGAGAGATAGRAAHWRGRMITGWLSDDDCPDCGGPLLDTSGPVWRQAIDELDGS